MGGNVAITVKEPNGAMWKMDRWTNIVPYYFSSIDLYNDNFSHWLKNFTQQWLLMKEDYENNKKTGQFKETMTSVYFPFNTTSPSEYGLIVVDAQKKKIYNAQNYSSVGKVELHLLDDKESQDNFQKLIKMGYIKNLTYKEKVAPNTYQTKFIPIKNPDVFLQDLKAIFNSGFSFFKKEDKESIEFQNTLSDPLKSIEGLSLFRFSIPIESDWTIFSVPVKTTRAAACVALLKEMLKDGWEFSDRDYKKWQEYLVSDWENDKDMTNINSFNACVPNQWQITFDKIANLTEAK